MAPLHLLNLYRGALRALRAPADGSLSDIEHLGPPLRSADEALSAPPLSEQLRTALELLEVASIKRAEHTNKV
jgi:hypothetical protein